MRRILAATAWLCAVAAPAHAQPSDALALFTRADKGGCIACHQLPAGSGPATRADVGPALAGARMRSLGKRGIREILADPMRANPVGALGDVSTKARADDARIRSTGSRIERSSSITSVRPSWISTSTG